MDSQHSVQPSPRELERAKLTVRADICRTCPHHSFGAAFDLDTPPACEKKCEVFVKLPELIERAEGVEPMVGSVEQVLDQQIQHICDTTEPPPGETKATRPLVRHREALIKSLKKTIG